MKRLSFLIIGILISILAYSQNKPIKTDRDSVITYIHKNVASLALHNETFGRYKIYQTDNIYILLKLDTATGKISMIQWNLDSSKEFEATLNSEDLSYGFMNDTGRFELYPTKNMYQFILIDTLMGFTWHVQWGTKEGEQWIRRIY
jgi:hypothetical protein